MASKKTSAASRATPRLSAADRRRTILDAALRLFAERGYEGASVDDIAAEAGITVAVIYRHFKSKEELHAEVLQEQWQHLLTRQAEVVFSVPPGRERLRAAYASFFEWFEEHPLALHLLFREIGGPPAVVRAHEQMLATATQAVRAVLASEDPADPRLSSEPGMTIVAEFLRGGTDAVARWWEENPEADREAIVDLLVDMTWNGLEPLGVEGKRP